MTPTVAAPHSASTLPHVPAAARVSMAASGALLAGVLTSYGQAVEPLSSVANSAGPWFLVAVGLLLAAGGAAARRLVVAMPLGVVFLELMHVGYWAATNLRGFPDVLALTNFWVLMGVPAGVLAGAVVVVARSTDGRMRGAAFGVTAAVLIGEGTRALLRVAETTGVVTWIVEIGVGVGLVVVGMVLARSPGGRVVALGTGVVGAVLVLAVYLLIGG